MLFCGHLASAAIDFSAVLLPTLRRVLPDAVGIHLIEEESALRLLDRVVSERPDLVILMFNPRIGSREFERVDRIYPAGNSDREKALAEVQALPEGIDYIKSVRTRTTKPIIAIHNGYLCAGSDSSVAQAAGADCVLPMPYSLRDVAGDLARCVQKAGFTVRQMSEVLVAQTNQRFTVMLAVNEPTFCELIAVAILASDRLPEQLDLIEPDSSCARYFFGHAMARQTDLAIVLVNNLNISDTPAGFSIFERYLWVVREFRRRSRAFLVALNGRWNAPEDFDAARKAGADLPLTLPFTFSKIEEAFVTAFSRWKKTMLTVISRTQQSESEPPRDIIDAIENYCESQGRTTWIGEGYFRQFLELGTDELENALVAIMFAHVAEIRRITCGKTNEPAIKAVTKLIETPLLMLSMGLAQFDSFGRFGFYARAGFEPSERMQEAIDQRLLELTPVVEATVRSTLPLLLSEGFQQRELPL